MTGGPDFSLLELFRDEARTHAATLAVGLEAVPTDADRLAELSRAAHSIRGAARIVGLDSAARLAQALEEMFDAARDGRAALDKARVDPARRAAAWLASLAEVGASEATSWLAEREAEVGQLLDAIKGPPTPPLPAAEPSLTPSPTQGGGSKTATGSGSSGPLAAPRPASPAPAAPPVDPSLLDMFREEVRVHAATLTEGLLGLEADPTNPQRIEPLMRAAHSVKGAARIIGLDAAVQLAHVLEDAFVAAQEGRTRITRDDIDVFLRGTDVLATLARVSSNDLGSWGQQHHGAVEELQVQLRAVAANAPREASAPRPAEPPPPEPPAPVAAPPPEPPSPAPVEAVEAVVRVTAGSLTRLMGLAGESLVQARWLQPFATALHKLKKHQDHLTALLDTVESAVTSGRADQLATLAADVRRQADLVRRTLADRIGEFEDHAAQAEDLNTRLYREVIASRMRPFADGTHAFPRMVRDVARRLGKEVRLEVDGATTEVDRDILERLEAPLTHLLRNSVDHGVEPPDRRRAAGKPETAVVRLEARHRAGVLLLTVSDDGGGIDVERLRKKVVERGLTTADMARSMDEAELLEFLFLPGFSTAAAVTEFSGRGVGLDVVQQTVREIGGSVQVSTKPGRGTKFVMRLPLTLSVVRAVLVEVAGEPYAFAHNRIERLLRVPRDAVRSLENRQFVAVDGQNVGLVLASQLFDQPPAPAAGDDLPVLLLGDTAGLYGLIVDAFLGEQDLVVRPLDPRLGKVPNVAAAAVLDDGTPVLIADAEDVVRSLDRHIQAGTLKRCERPTDAVTRVRKRVLVVDDSITVREVERQLLSARGYDVSVAVDGQDGWNRLQGDPFDLLVTDVDMPRMNGLDLVRAVRSDRRLSEVPVVIISYKDRPEDRLRGLDVGANYYLTKSSFHDDTFLRAVSDLIGEA